jgi:hypothetical protein
VTDLDRLEQLARAATPGPWQVDRVNHDGCARVCDGTCLGSHADCDAIVTADGFDHLGANDSNPDYIAAASPDVVLSLLAELRKLRALRDLVQDFRDDDGKVRDAEGAAPSAFDCSCDGDFHDTTNMECLLACAEWDRDQARDKVYDALDSLDAEDK